MMDSAICCIWFSVQNPEMATFLQHFCELPACTALAIALDSETEFCF